MTQLDKYLNASKAALTVAQKFVDGHAEYTDENGATVATTVSALKTERDQKRKLKKKQLIKH